MHADQLKEICIKSCKDMYEQMEVMQQSAESTNRDVSTVVNDIDNKTLRDGYWEIKLRRRIQDIDRIGIRIMGDDDDVLCDYGSNDVFFDEYDEYSMTIRAYIVSEDLNTHLANCDKDRVKIISDMKWLIKLTQNMYEENGYRLSYPNKKPHFAHDDYNFPNYPDGRKPTEQQKEAVHKILNSSMSYVWGAPGTGKTQFVLATAIIAHIKKGHRVAIIAPTNNSLEQVLRGILKVLSSDDPNHEYITPEKDIIRLGVPTHSFLKEYKEICENKAISKEIAAIDKALKNLDQVQLASTVNFIFETIDSIKKILRELPDTRDLNVIENKNEDLDAYIDSIRNMLDNYDSFKELLNDVTHRNIASKIGFIESEMAAVDKSRLSNEKYGSMDDDEIDEERARLTEERQKLSMQETNNRIGTVKIMAMTPYIMMSRRRVLFDTNGIVDVDHIFIDEVGYSNLIQTLPVFMCGPPVSMLGDHMQLPPVCELEREMLIDFYDRANDDGYMKYGFIWDQPILNLESYFSKAIEECAEEYINEAEPEFNEIVRCDLTESHRFNDNLAKILDECVYKNGIRGSGADPIELICIDIVNNKPRDKRANVEEANAIERFLEKEEGNLGEFAILTPYRDQRMLIERKCKGHKDDVMTIHSSQGREWDTIIISICDDDGTNRPIPLRFTSSIDGYGGLKVMNTAVSRAKKRIVLVCNHDFWSRRASKGDLLGKIAASSKVINV